MAELTIALAAKGRCDPAPFWAAIAGEGYDDPNVVELHMAYDDPGAIVGMLACVTAHRRDDASLFALWGVAAAQGSARYVAILQIQAPPAPGWLAAMLRAIRGGGAAYQGPVAADYSPGDPRMIGYLAEYAQFHPPVDAAMSEVAGNNLVLRRDLLPAPAVLVEQGFSKTSLLDEWKRTGFAPARIDDAIVRHVRPFALAAYCRRRFRHGRAYAAARLRASGAPPRLLAIGFVVLLPAVRLARILRHARRIAALRRAGWRHLPALLAAETAWSLGELAGYAGCGPGNPALLD